MTFRLPMVVVSLLLSLPVVSCTSTGSPPGGSTLEARGRPTRQSEPVTCESINQEGLVTCDGICCDLMKDEENCGACGFACGPGERCMNGSCQLSCQAGLANCAGMCTDLNQDENNCGACGSACGPGQLCVNGTCAVTCPMGQSLCAGQCVDFMTDVNHCGACGSACGPGQSCVNGQCSGGVLVAG